MTNFRIEVVVDPARAVDGTKKVGRELDGLERKADGLGKTLKRAFQLIGVGLIVRELQQLADGYTNAQNKLRTVITGEEQLTAVTRELFEISNRTRSSFQGAADIYSRVALATKDLGTTQQEVLHFTESLNQAIILSGASAAESEAGLIQLSQGLASGALRGDELRAVLEQLPAVADVIAKSLGVTRGELRQLGADGKITAEVVLGAFREAREELDERFAKSVPTIGQSFVVLKNNVLQFVGEADKATGVSAALAGVILFLSENIDILAISVGILTLALGAQYLTNVAASIAATGGLTARVAALNAVMLANPVAIFAIAVAALTAATVAWGVAMIGVEEEISKIEAAGNKLQLTEFGKLGDDILVVKKNLADAERVLAGTNGRMTAAGAKVEQYRDKLRKLTEQQDLLRTGQARTTVQSEALQKANDALAKSVGDVIASIEQENTLLALNSREREIQAALLKEIATLNKGEGPDVTEAQKADLEAALRRNQALREQDAILQKIRGPQQQFVADLSTLQGLLAADKISLDEFNKGLLAIGTSTDGIDLKALGVTGGGDSGAIASIQAQIAAQKALATAESNRARVLQEINGPAQELIDKQEILRSLLADCSIKQDQYNTVSDATAEALRRLNPAYSAQQDLLEEILGPMRQAEERQKTLDAAFSENRISLERYTAETLKLLDVLYPMTEQEQRQADILKELLGPTKDLEQRQKDLNAAFLDGSIKGKAYTDEVARIQEALHPLTEAQKLQADLIERANAPQVQLIATQNALAAAFANNKISVEQYATMLDQATIAANTLGSDASAGLAAGLAQIRLHLNDVGGAVERTIVNGFKAGEDALVSFVTTGKADFAGFVNSILDDLARLAIQQLLLGLFPAPGGAPGGAGAGGGGLGFGGYAALFAGAQAEGGPVEGGMSYLVGEEGPEIFHSPKGGGNIVPAGETAAIMRSSAAAPVVNVAPAQVQIVNVSDPAEIPRAIQSQAGEEAVMNVISRKRQTVKGLTR